MVIRFLCPNGHKINCPETHVGRLAKCPQCSERFLVPTPPETQATRLESDPSKASPAGSGVRAKEPQIEFLCPNGHHLHGPASLQGHPGQCPECGSKFRIPSYEDLSEDEEEEPEQNLGIGPADETTAGVAMAEEPTGLPEIVGEAEPAVEIVPESEPVLESKRAWATLVAEFWKQRTETATLEIQLTDGTKLVPDRFAFSRSTADYGIFSVKDNDGLFNVVAIAWDSVACIQLRRMKHVPKDLFEPRTDDYTS